MESDKGQPRKQRHTAVRVYHRLCDEHGYKSGETTVRRYVREARWRLGLDRDRVFIPLDPELGGEAEVDWGTCHAILADEATKLKMFCMRSKGSGKQLVQCFPCERQQAFFEGHMRGFSFFGGVFPVLVYDNLTTAVEKVLRGKERRLQKGFSRFQAYYNFSARFCNRGQGHEKGGVEGLVGYARRNYMVPDGLEELNRRLWEQCMAHGGHRIAGRDRTVHELYEEEKVHLLVLPEVPFSNIETCSAKVDKYSTVIVDKNRYSVPTRHAGLRVEVLISVGWVEIFKGDRRIARHRRVYGNNKWQLDPLHYLELLSRRPQAFGAARPIRQWRKTWPECLEKLRERFCDKQGRNRGTKDFIQVLLFFKDHEAGAAVAHLLRHGRASETPSMAPLKRWPRLSPPDVSVYGRIGGQL